jgi:hypothetical protein
MYLAKQIIRVVGMVIVGLSAVLIAKYGAWYIILWVIGWNIYDMNIYFNNHN